MVVVVVVLVLVVDSVITGGAIVGTGSGAVGAGAGAGAGWFLPFFLLLPLSIAAFRFPMLLVSVGRFVRKFVRKFVRILSGINC